VDDLIEALGIFRRYSDTKFPTHCEHDVMYVAVPPDNMKPSHIARLKTLGFNITDSGEMFESTLFGSC
jgi:hypothetical protein